MPLLHETGTVVPPSELADTLGALVSVTHRLTRLAARAADGTESPAVWRTLSVLREAGPMRLGELAEFSRVSQPTMTKIVRSLVEREWVRRIADVSDARAWQIDLAEKGGAALDGWRDQLGRALLPTFADVDEADAAVLRRATDILSARLEANRVRPAEVTA
ncbi:MarR family transcriptional regulator [Agromyces atrinae]|uniref:MarR family winged helix-turn-helix transcriptional regulator n=1 Tax=Agromyces atrinae TaxID=592376 RepID=UPI001F5A1D09|nr:MarR family transcriptional regulator [Agromyces atrinae]MCI2957487.1 MarR family transcriptional regulator [Agromyces atrinae]